MKMRPTAPSALERAARAVYEAANAGHEVQALLPPLLDALLDTKCAGTIRDVLPSFEDWTIPTRIQLAMHVQLLRTAGAQASDELRLAQFLHLFYEEMDEWSTALHVHAVGSRSTEPAEVDFNEITEKISEEQAYRAMLMFLDSHHHCGVHELGALLGSMALLSDGRPADPGIAQEWRAALKSALAQG